MDGPNNNVVLQRFPPCLRSNIREIWADGKIGKYKNKNYNELFTPVTFKGISGMNIGLVPFPNKRITEDCYELYSYQFVIKIPYAGKLLEWEVMFNEEDIGFAPDFDFRDEHFLAYPSLETMCSNIPTLAQWNLQNPKALITVLKELVNFYRKKQVGSMILKL